MPLPGGATDKFGIRYEGLWTVSCMVEVLEERADSIRLEPPGEEGEGAEFWLRCGDITEYHQVKRQYSQSGRWTLAELERTGRVLSHFLDKLNDSDVRCVFVSTQSAYQLNELSDRARRSNSFDEFKQEFLKDKKNAEAFRDLFTRWNLHGAEIKAYDALKRIRVVTIDECSLRTTHLESRLTALVEGNPPNIRETLAQFALDNVHHELIASDIWDHLKERGYRPREWSKDPLVLSAVQSQNDRYLSQLRDEVITESSMLRDEVNSILDNFVSSDNNKNVLITGEAGVGKSNVILQVVEKLQDQSLPVLAFRVDRLSSTQLPDDVGSQLGLPGSPANVLAAISQGRDCVLVIDQLDAVSLATGRNPDFFDCIHEIINQTEAYPQMLLLLACRKFDIDNDHRLRRLTSKEGTFDVVPIKPLPHETVRSVVNDLGLDSKKLNTNQLKLLSIPLHLRILSEISENKTNDVLNFESVRDLYHGYWDYKQTVIRERLGRSIRWTQVVDALCDYMSTKQLLYSPKYVVDEYPYDARAMASEHVLILDDGKYAFFHEGFFDYAFARRFAARKQDILSLLLSDEQHLFRRAQVRQILLHEREMDFDCYIEHLDAMLSRPDIRFHLKKVVFSLLAELSDPREEEWSVIAKFIDDHEYPESKEVRRILYGSVPWFKLLDSFGLIEIWLADHDEKIAARARDLSISVQRTLSDRVSEIIEPYVGRSERWDHRLAHIFQFSDLSAGRRFFELTLKLIDDGCLDKVDTENPMIDDFWFRRGLINLPESHPDWVCELIGHFLRRRLILTLKQGQFNPFDINGNIGTNSRDIFKRALLTSAEGAPVEFVNQLLPFMLHVIGFTAQSADGPPYNDPVWKYHHYDWAVDASDAILAGMETALSELAVNRPEYLEYVAGQLDDLDFETIQYLLIRAYTANGERFAADATDYLCAKISRLETGYISSPHWATRELLESITPYCSDLQLSRLEDMILNYYSEWEKSEKGSYSYGHAQFVLLKGFNPSRRSEQASQRLEELALKFGDWRQDPKDMVRAGPIRSPIPESEADKMNDNEWLEAVSHYNYDHTDRIGREDQDFFIGGAHELSGVLEKQTKIEPKRFAELALQFPDDTHKCYFNAILRGISDADLDVKTVLQVCQRCHRLPDRPCKRWICQPIANLAEQPLPNEALDIVSWYATEDPDPKKELWRTRADGGDFYYGGDISMAGLNSARGGAAEAMGKLIHFDKDRIRYFLPALEQMIRDPSIAVRAWVVRTLTAVLVHDRDLAVRLFKTLCETEDELLGINHVEYFIKYALQTHFCCLKPIIERMLASEVPEAVRIAARQVCLASLYVEEAKPLANRCMSGTETQRLSSAEVFALNLREFRPLCEDKLIQLFDDPDDEVRVEASNCFNRFEGNELGEYVGLIETFVESSAFDTTRSSLINALEKTTAKVPDITCQVCERYLDAPSSHRELERHALSDIRVSQLILRIYRQTNEKALRTRCLNLIDRIMQIESYGLDRGLNEELSLYDR